MLTQLIPTSNSTAYLRIYKIDQTWGSQGEVNYNKKQTSWKN